MAVPMLRGLPALLLCLVAACSTSPPQGSPPGSPPAFPRGSASPSPLDSFYRQQLAWQPCEGTFECSTASVPVDYADPSGPTLDLALIRHQGATPQGSLLLNPGGPGGSGVDLAKAAYYVLSPELRAAYDVVGFDPRGVGRSQPVQCLTTGQLDGFVAADWTPDSAEEEEQLAEEVAALGSGCLRDSAGIASHMSTAEAARDMDVLRAALGDEQLNYLGWSYGSYLGQEYAVLFPDRVGRFVLDGILPLSTDLDQWFGEQAVALDAGLRRFVADCVGRASCPLSGSTDEGVAQIQGLLARLDEAPLTDVGGRVLTESLALAALQSAVFTAPDSWATLRTALESALAGDGTGLMRMADDWLYRDPADGSYATNANEAVWAVTCLDDPASGGIGHVRAQADDWSSKAPVFGRYNAWAMLNCWQWPAGTGVSALTPAPEADHGPAMLLVSTVYDPATPHAWGLEVESTLSNAVLLTYEGDGHTAYLRGSACIDSAVDSYLVDGTLPPTGATCPPDGEESID